ncbi:hypothetical protein HPE39_13065 [Escherichia coli]|nr:hypothetical protein HPE39_13065 [Escherichia coli]
MTQEEKVMFLMRLAVDTYNTQFTEKDIPQKAVPAAVDKGGAIAVFYDAFESFNEKLDAVSDFGTSSNK